MLELIDIVSRGIELLAIAIIVVAIAVATGQFLLLRFRGANDQAYIACRDGLARALLVGPKYWWRRTLFARWRWSQPSRVSPR